MAEITVKIWGARGSRPVPGRETLIYGGNTACIELRFGDRLVILDAGSGICGLSQALSQSQDRVDADILITHTHWDHIIGIPFFQPMYKKNNRFRIYGTRSGEVSFEEQIRAVMRDPHFPVRFDQLSSRYQLVELDPGESFEIQNGERGILVETLANRHPNGGISYKLTFSGKTLCYMTDLEIEDQDSDEARQICKFVAGADLMFFDTNYTDEEYFGRVDGKPKRLWGHSTWQTAVALADRAGVKQLGLFHHSAERTDREMQAIERAAQAQRPQTFAAMEGMVITL